MLATLPIWIKFLISLAVSLAFGFLLLDRAAVNPYILAAVFLAVGGFLFWKNERPFAYGIFATVAVGLAILLLAIQAFAKMGG